MSTKSLVAAFDQLVFVRAFSCSCPSYKTELVLVHHLLPHHPDLLKHSKFYKNCTGSVTLNTSRNSHCDFLQVSFSVAKFKAFFFLTKLQMAHVWTKKPCKSPLRGITCHFYTFLGNSVNLYKFNSNRMLTVHVL